VVEVSRNAEALQLAADTARLNSRQLRLTLNARRVELRRSLSTSHRNRAAAALTMRCVERNRELRLRSPWTDLPWIIPHEDLHDVLVLHDGRRSGPVSPERGAARTP
jgi:hypothetical protein